jgi:hypothetical protein
MAVNRVKSVAVIVVCIFAMATCVPVICRVNKAVGVVGIVVCALVLVHSLMPSIRRHPREGMVMDCAPDAWLKSEFLRDSFSD